MEEMHIFVLVGFVFSLSSMKHNFGAFRIGGLEMVLKWPVCSRGAELD